MACLAMFSLPVLAQLETETPAEEQTEEQDNKCLKKGNVVFDVYYGPAGPGLLARGLTVDGGETSFLGPIGLRAQFMVADAFGIGVDAHYATRGATWPSFDLDGNDHQDSYKVQRIRVMARFSWELVRSERFGLNWANSIGYKNVSRSLDDPDYNSGLSFTGSIPVGFRTAMGARFFATDNIALNADIGFFGGAFVHGGLSIKL